MRPYPVLLLVLASCNYYTDTVDPAVMAANIAEADIGAPPELTPELKVGLEEWLRPRFEYDPDGATFRWFTATTPQRDYFQPGVRRARTITVIKRSGNADRHPLLYAWRAIVLVKARNERGAMKELAWSLYLLDGTLIGVGSPRPGVSDPQWVLADGRYTGLEVLLGLGEPIPFAKLKADGAATLARRSQRTNESSPDSE